MRQPTNPVGRVFISVALVIAGGFCALTIAQDTGVELEAALEAIQSTPPTPASELPASGTFFSVQHAFDWPPFPGNALELSAWPLGDDLFLLDDADVDYEALAELIAAAGFPAGGLLLNFQSRTFTTNDLWLEIHGVTNGCTGWTADLTIHTPEGDTNSSYDLLYSPTLDSPTDWQFLMRCPTNLIAQTNIAARWLCEEQGYFALTQTNGDLTVTTNVTAQEMAEMLVPPWVTVTNAAYVGSNAARGMFFGGNGCGLPIESGVILSSGRITNAIGANDDDGSFAVEHGSVLGTDKDADLDELVGGTGTTNAAVLEFDVYSTSSFALEFRYVFASEEYPEWIAQYNDPMAIFVSTNRVGANWIITTNDNVVWLPCTVNVLVGVSTINGGYTNSFSGDHASPTNPQYYADNHDPSYSAVSPYALSTPVINTQYDGMTVMLRAEVSISANVTNHVKIGIADYGGPYGDDQVYGSTVFLGEWSSNECQ